MQADNKNLSYINLAILGGENSGKCTLAKSISICTQAISTPSNFTYNSQKYYLLPIPCIPSDYTEKYEMAINICDIGLIVIDIGDLLDSFSSKNSIYKYILDLILRDVQNVIFCINKIDKIDFSQFLFDGAIKKLNDFILPKIRKVNQILDTNKINFEYVMISAKEGINLMVNIANEDKSSWYKGETLMNTLNKVSIIYKERKFENKEATFLVYDFYKDSDYFVISGKILAGKMIITSVKSYFLTPANKIIKVEKICNCEGIYVESALEREFITLKCSLDSISNSDIISKGDLITTIPENNISPILNFNTFEADIQFVNSCFPSVFSPGFECMINFNTIDKLCLIDSIIGEYDDGKKLEINKF